MASKDILAALRCNKPQKTSLADCNVTIKSECDELRTLQAIQGNPNKFVIPQYKSEYLSLTPP